MHREYVADIWEDAFQPEYEESEDRAAIASHFSRHRFTTYCRVEQDLNRELIRHMRGDTAGAGSIDERGAIDEYINTYYRISNRLTGRTSTSFLSDSKKPFWGFVGSSAAPVPSLLTAAVSGAAVRSRSSLSSARHSKHN